jgi:transposase
MPNRLLQREQAWLLPPTLAELIPPGHASRFVAQMVEQFDAQWWRDEFGEPPGGALTGPAAYSPEGLLAIWMYGFMTGVRSTRKLEAACREQVPFMWLAGYQTPDHNTLWRFYNEHRDQMRKVFKRTVGIAVRSGLIDLALQAVDGTKVEANAARDQTYGKARLAKLMAEVDRTIAELEQAGGSEEHAPAELPEDLHSAQALKERLQEAERLMEEEDLPAVSLTDPDARFMKPSHGQITMAYNAQAMVSALEEGGTVPFITAAEVTQDANDSQQLVPMIAAAEANGVHAEVTAADGGYHTGAALDACAEQGHSVVMPADYATPPADPYHQEYFEYDETAGTYRCPQGQTLRLLKVVTRGNISQVKVYGTEPRICRSCPAFGQCTTSRRHGRWLEVSPYKQVLRQHRDRMKQPEAKALLGLRGQLVELVFGVMKEQQRGRRFLTRGLAKVGAEWQLLATGYNLRVLHKIWQRRLLDGPFGSPCRSRGVSCTRLLARFGRFRAVRRLIHRSAPALPAQTTPLPAAA